jgi:hypothetical protein
MRDAANTLRTIQRIRIRDATNTLRTVFLYLTASLDATTAYGQDDGAAAFGTVTSAAVTVTPSGGTAPYTYSWEWLNGDLAVSADTPTAATTTFSGLIEGIATAFAYFRCLVTDANGSTVYTETVTVQLDWYDNR